MTRVRVRICGRVHGVFFRDTCVREALAAGVAGWVRNNPDGSVEAVFEGDTGAVDQMTAWCGDGPPQATVSSVEVIAEVPEGERGFRVR